MAALAFAPPTQLSKLSASSNSRTTTQHVVLSMAGGEGGDKEWVKALLDAGGGTKPGQFEEDMKMKGLLGPNKGMGNPKLNANSRLIAWLETEGDVYLYE